MKKLKSAEAAGLRIRLNKLTTWSLTCSLGTFFLVVTAVQLFSMRRSWKTEETRARASLIAKGRILMSNITPALRGMARDNSFIAIRDLVASNVLGDADIVHGIFMDGSKRPWVIADTSGSRAFVPETQSLTDSMSDWAHNQEAPAYKDLHLSSETTIEFSAPIFDDSVRVGTVRYGLSTASLSQTIAQTRKLFLRQAILLLSLLFASGVFLYVLIARLTRTQAQSIIAPILDLTDAANRIAHGKYDTPVPAMQGGEIGLLARSFEAMRMTIRNYTQNLETMVFERTAELEAAQQELLHKNRQLEATNARLTDLECMKEMLTNTLVHDIKNIIFTMAGDTRYLVKSTVSIVDESCKRKMAKIDKSCHEVFRLTSNILDISRMEEGRITLTTTPLDARALSSMITDVEGHTPLSDSHITLTILPCPEYFRIMADRGLIERIFQNLLSNAAKYGTKGGRVEVSFTNQDPFKVIRVHSLGNPIPSQTRDEIFKKFSRLSNDGSLYSKGLGLFFCKIAMEAHGGKIWLETDPEGNGICLGFPSEPFAASLTPALMKGH